MRIVDLSGEFQARQRLAQMGMQRADHDKHECFGVAAERLL